MVIIKEIFVFLHFIIYEQIFRGADYLKVDGCNAGEDTFKALYPKLGQYLNATNRHIVYSCSWPAYTDLKTTDFKLLAKICNLWRNYGDISNGFGAVTNIADTFGDRQDIYTTAGPGAWNDPDMLVIGNGINEGQSRYQMAIWSILAAPLLMSTELDQLTPGLKNILLNRDVLAVNQDPMGKTGRRYVNDHDNQVWARTLSGGSVAIAVANLGSDKLPVNITFDPSTMGVVGNSQVSNLFDLGAKYPSYDPKIANLMTVLVPQTGKFGRDKPVNNS